MEVSYRVMCRKKTTAEFIEDARKVHGDRYDYSEVVYKNNATKVKITCKKHGVFEQRPEGHIRGSGCQSCGWESTGGAGLRRARIEFVSKAMAIHGSRYDYSEVAYSGRRSKVRIICRKHGAFMQTPKCHLGRQGCPSCGIESVGAFQSMRSAKAGVRFEAEAKKVHGDKYDYSEVIYKGCHSKVKIICKEHGVFEQSPINHLRRQGCRRCVTGLNSKQSAMAATLLALKANGIHGDKYDYSEVIYKGCHSKVKIICKEHGVFEQSPESHLAGYGCRICGLKVSGVNRLMSFDEFKSKAMSVHGERYDYSVAIYEGNKKKVKIICKEHGVFEQSPSGHLSGNGCPVCKASKMERAAALVLGDIGIDFSSNTSLMKRRKFDVVIPSLSQLWEFDGEQHFMPVEMWGGEESLARSINRDAEKTRWAIDNEWTLIRVPYWDQDNIESYIREYTAIPPPPGLIITSHSNGEHSYDKILEAAGGASLGILAKSHPITDSPYMVKKKMIESEYNSGGS